MLLAARTAGGQAWSGILPPSRGYDWTHAGVWDSYPLTGHGIPHRSVQCMPTGIANQQYIVNGVVTPSGRNDLTDANTINQAIQYCATLTDPALGKPYLFAPTPAPNPMYLQIGAGTFYTSGGVTFGQSTNTWPAPYGPFTKIANYLTIRGMGPDRTKFVTMTTGIQCGPWGNTICMMGSSQDGSSTTTFGYAGACNWTAGYAQGTTQLTLANCMTNPQVTNQNGVPNRQDGMPEVGMRIILDQRNEDIGLIGCSSSGTVATCVATVSPLPSTYTAGTGTCIGIAGTGNSGIANVAPGTTVNGQIAAGYNVTLKTRSYTGPGSQTCIATITAIGTDTTNVLGIPSGATHMPTISYTLPAGGSNAATWFCGTSPGPATTPSSGATNNPALNSATNGTVNACWAVVDNGGVFVSGAPCLTSAGNCASAGSASLGGGLDLGRWCPDGFYSAAGRAWAPSCQGSAGAIGNEVSFRSQARVVTVTAVNGNVITVEPPLNEINWRASQAPGVYWFRYYVHDVGVEDLTIDGTNDGGTAVNSSSGLNKCYNCWFRNVRSIVGSRNHVMLVGGTSHIEIRDSYFWGTKRGATQSYGVEPWYAPSDTLVENNIFIDVVTPLMNGGSIGNVESYNYILGDGSSSVMSMSGVINANHDVAAYGLFEGNNAPITGYDNIHGQIGGPSTHFRERYRGQNYPFGPLKNAYLRTISVSRFNRGLNFIGNVLGTPPPSNANAQTLGQTSYQVAFGQNTVQGCNTPNRPIYCGFGGNSQNENPVQADDDPLTPQSLFRWGNYDVVTALGGDGTGIRWCATGNEPNCNVGCTPNQAPLYSASCSEAAPGALFLLPAVTPPANHNLPASFYLPGKPTWYVTPWGTPPWPTIGPDITGGDNDDDASGHSFMNPAQLALRHLAIDTGYVEPRNQITAESWSSSTNTVTMTGTFYIDLATTFQVRGAVPAGFNGNFAVVTSDAAQPGYINPNNAPGNATCGNRDNPCIGLPNTRNNMQFGSYVYGMTRITPSGETLMGPTVRTVAVSGTFTAAGCPGNGTSPPGGDFSCTVRIPGMAVNGAGNSTTWNLYMGIQTGLAAGVMCRQNLTPIDNAPNGVYFQQDPVIMAVNTDGSVNPACIQPPTHSEATASTLTYWWSFNPCGDSSTTCNLTTPGTITSPIIHVFNANNLYGVGTLPPQPPTASMAVNPLTIQAGQSATLTWLTNGADTVSISPSVGTVPVSGSHSVSPAATTTYTLSATNANGTVQAFSILTVGTPQPATTPTGVTGNGQITGRGKIS